MTEYKLKISLDDHPENPPECSCQRCVQWAKDCIDSALAAGIEPEVALGLKQVKEAK